MIPFDNKSVFNTFLYIRYTLAVSGNFMVLRILGSFPALRTPANMLVMNLAVSDFLLMITLLPEACYNFFTGGPWRFGDLGCQIHAFCGNDFNSLNLTNNYLKQPSNPHCINTRSFVWIQSNYNFSSHFVGSVNQKKLFQIFFF